MNHKHIWRLPIVKTEANSEVESSRCMCGAVYVVARVNGEQYFDILIDGNSHFVTLPEHVKNQ